MHHLPDDLKGQGLSEIVRMLKSEGRLLVLDLKGHTGQWKSSVADQPPLMKEVGFSQVGRGDKVLRIPRTRLCAGEKKPGRRGKGYPDIVQICNDELMLLVEQPHRQ